MARRRKLCDTSVHVDGLPVRIVWPIKENQRTVSGFDLIEACPNCKRLGHPPLDNYEAALLVLKTRFNYKPHPWQGRQAMFILPSAEKAQAGVGWGDSGGWQCSSGAYFVRRLKERPLTSDKVIPIKGRRRRATKAAV